MSDPYAVGMIKSHPFVKKRDVRGRLAVILRGKLEKRGLNLVAPISRVVRKNEVHEIIITDEPTAGPGKLVNRIAYVGFAEITCGGVLVVGDELTCGGRLVGRIAGFDETHLPNHLNIVLFGERLAGTELNLSLESEITITGKRGDGNVR